MCSRFYQWYQWYTNIVQGSTNGTIGNTNGTIGTTIGTNGNANGTIGPPNGTIGTNGKPMVPLVKFPMVPLGKPRTHALLPILFLYFQYILTKIYILHQNVVDSLPLQHQAPH